jgi:PqqD family protein of HPr-rel-A system
VTSWRAAYALERRAIDGETIVYCDETGDTFKVAPIARAVLEAVGAGAADLPALTAQAAQTLGAADVAAVEPAVAETVGDLETLGIIERVSL